MLVDSLSRSNPLSSEWALHHKSLQWILSKGFQLKVDLFFNQRKLSASDLCLFRPRHPGICCGRFLNRLEPLGLDIPVSTIVPDFVGFTPSHNLQKQGHSDNASLVQSTLISSPPAQDNQESLLTGAQALSDSAWANQFLLITSIPLPNFVGVMRWIYTHLFLEESAEVLVTALRVSTKRQLETAWSSFIFLLRCSGYQTVSTEVVFNSWDIF